MVMWMFAAINSFLAVLATSLPINIFAQNNGIISFTLCASRIAGIFAGLWLILFGVLGKVRQCCGCGLPKAIVTAHTMHTVDSTLLTRYCVTFSCMLLQNCQCTIGVTHHFAIISNSSIVSVLQVGAFFTYTPNCKIPTLASLTTWQCDRVLGVFCVVHDTCCSRCIHRGWQTSVAIMHAEVSVQQHAVCELSA